MTYSKREEEELVMARFDTVPISDAALQELRRVAEIKRLPLERMIRAWILDRLDQERVGRLDT